MFARTQCRYLYIYTVYLYANKADSSCSSSDGGSNTEAAADYSYAPLAHKLNCIKIINGITRVSVARCVSTHAHPSPAHTPPHTPLVHTQVCRHLQSKASLAQFLIIIYEACRQGETRKDTQTDSGRCCSALGASCTGSAPQARRSFYLHPHTPPQIDRAAFATFSFSHFFVDSLQRGNRFNGACAATNSVLPLPRPFASAPLLLSSCDRQISACDLQISRQTELKMPTWVNCCLSKQLPTPAVSLPCCPSTPCHPAYLTVCHTVSITQFCSCH